MATTASPAPPRTRRARWPAPVRAGREEEVARAVAALDLELALFPDGLAGRAVDALRELVAGGALLPTDPLTAEMLEAFGWRPLGELVDDTHRGPVETT